MENETVILIKDMFGNDVSLLENPTSNRIFFIFSGEQWAHSWQPKDSLRNNTNK